MKSIFTVAAIFLGTLCFAQSKTESEILSLSKKRADWLLAGNIDSLANLYDVNSVTVHGNGMVKSGEEHLEDVRNKRPIYRSIDIKESFVRDFGNAAVLVGKGVFSISFNGQDITQHMVFTDVYLRKAGAWKLISRQASQVQ